MKLHKVFYNSKAKKKKQKCYGSSFLLTIVSLFVGLDYLHKGCNLPIIHGDMKTNNILLGQNFKAKIADFGTHISAVAAGSMGYIDSEYESLLHTIITYAISTYINTGQF